MKLLLFLRSDDDGLDSLDRALAPSPTYTKRGAYSFYTAHSFFLELCLLTLIIISYGMIRKQRRQK